MPAIDPYVWDTSLQSGTGAAASAADIAQGNAGILRGRTDQEINSLMDLMNSQTAQGAGSIPSGFDANPYAGTAVANPANWRMSRADAESPLGYMGQAMQGGAQNWRPNDQGGYFTLDQLYGAGKVPGIFSFGSNQPSTNNWQLTVPFGGGPGFIMRNGRLIQLGHNAQYGLPANAVSSGGASGESGQMLMNYAQSPGGGYAYGVPSKLKGALYWPGGSAIGIEPDTNYPGAS